MTELSEEVTTYLDDATLAEIEERLDYGDSKSEWFREACRQRLSEECDIDVSS